MRQAEALNTCQILNFTCKLILQNQTACMQRESNHSIFLLTCSQDNKNPIFSPNNASKFTGNCFQRHGCGVDIVLRTLKTHCLARLLIEFQYGDNRVSLLQMQRGTYVNIVLLVDVQYTWAFSLNASLVLGIHIQHIS